MCLHLCIYIHVNICVFIQMHTHTHTHTGEKSGDVLEVELFKQKVCKGYKETEKFQGC